MNKKQKFYCKLGQAVVNMTLGLAFSAMWAGFFVYALIH